jgi:hypothetical protein
VEEAATLEAATEVVAGIIGMEVAAAAWVIKIIIL